MDILPDLLPSESDDLVVDISLDAASSGVSVISNSLVGFYQRIDWLNGWQICWVIDISSFDSSSQSSSKVLSIIFSLLLTLTLLLLLLLLLVLSVGLVTVDSFDELLLCLWSPWSTSSSQNLTFRLCSTWQGNLTVDNFSSKLSITFFRSLGNLNTGLMSYILILLANLGSEMCVR